MNATPCTRLAPPAAVATIDFDNTRVTVERVRCADTGGHLHVRLRPAHVPRGAIAGPRIAMEFLPEQARALAALLIAQADGIEPAASASTQPPAQRRAPSFIACVDDLDRALSQAEAMAGHGYGASAEGFHALSAAEHDAYMWGLADRIREAHAAVRRLALLAAQAEPMRAQS